MRQAVHKYELSKVLVHGDDKPILGGRPLQNIDVGHRSIKISYRQHVVTQVLKQPLDHGPDPGIHDDLQELMFPIALTGKTCSSAMRSAA